MGMLKNFAPWIAFLAVTGITDWRLGLLAGLVIQIAMIATSRPVRIGILNGAMLGFFAVALAFAVARPDSRLEDYIGAISTAWLGLVSLVSLLIGKPFTLSIARAGVSPEVAATHAFLETNRIITAVWTGYFAIAAAAGAVAATSDIRGARAVQILLLIGAIKFTADYPKRVHARMQQHPQGTADLPSTP